MRAAALALILALTAIFLIFGAMLVAAAERGDFNLPHQHSSRETPTPSPGGG